LLKFWTDLESMADIQLVETLSWFRKYSCHKTCWNFGL